MSDTDAQRLFDEVAVRAGWKPARRSTRLPLMALVIALTVGVVALYLWRALTAPLPR